MALYCIGDIQGCDAALQRLLDTVDFSPSRDTVYLLGDLVNRGPQSAEVLRRCARGGDSLRALLGNHDLHLLAAAHGARKPSRRDTLAGVLQAPDRDALLDWLKRQPLAREHRLAGERLLMVHAGVLPSLDGRRHVGARRRSAGKAPGRCAAGIPAGHVRQCTGPVERRTVRHGPLAGHRER